MGEISNYPRLSTGGRLPILENSHFHRATAQTFTIVWIPASLLFILFLTSLWSWSILSTRWNELSQSNRAAAAIQPQAISHNAVEKAPKETTVVPIYFSPGLTPEIEAWSAEISRWAATYQLDPNLIAIVMQIESCGYRDARSSAGAMGLFQVMPFHFAANENPYDPETNAKRGLSYLSRGLELAGGRVDLALAGYNGGHSVIFINSSDWPEETKRYVSWGMNILQEIERGSGHSPTLQAWLNAGGDRLCSEASQFHAAMHP